MSSSQSIDLELTRRSPANLRAALWALRAHARARRGVARDGIERPPLLPAPPVLPSAAVRGVLAVLHRRRASCLERSIVLQRWFASQGRPLELVIGVDASGETFGAHAWLEGENPPHGQDEGDYQEIHRLPALP